MASQGPGGLLLSFALHFRCSAAKKTVPGRVSVFDFSAAKIGGQNRREATGAQTRGRCNVLRRTLLTPLRLVCPKASQPGWSTRRLSNLATPPEGFVTWPIHPKASRPGWSTRRFSNLATLPEGLATWPNHPKVFRPGRSTRGFHDPHCSRSEDPSRCNFILSSFAGKGKSKVIAK